MGGARVRNIGWRIDYFVVSEALAPLLKKSIFVAMSQEATTVR